MEYKTPRSFIKGYDCKSCNKQFSNIEKTSDRLYNWRSSIPLLLKCGHSLCQYCIENSLRNGAGSVVCPECKEISVSSITGISANDNRIRNDFPVNIYTTGLLHTLFQKKMSANNISSNLLTLETPPAKVVSNHMKCSECSNNTAELKCVQCSDIFCDPCFKAVHGRSKVLSKHKSELLKDPESYIEDDFTLELYSENSKCPTHASQPHSLYCEDCSIIICPLCFKNGHKDHSIVGIEEKNKAVLGDLSTAVENVKPTLHRLQYNLQKLKSKGTSRPPNNGNVANTLSANEKDLEKKIRQICSFFHSQIQLKEKQLIDSLAVHHGGTKQMLAIVEAELEQNLKMVNSLIQNARKLIEKPSFIALNIEKLISKLKEIPDTTPCHVVTEENITEGKLELKYDESLIKTVIGQMEINFPKQANQISLKATKDLPENFEVEPIPLVQAPSVPKTQKSTSIVSRPPSKMYSRPSSVTSDQSDIDTIDKSDYFRPDSSKMPEEVIISHVNNPSSFFVQRKRTYEQDILRIKQYIDFGSIEKQKPPVNITQGDIFLTKYKVDKDWYRVQVIKILEKDKVEVFYLDYGNEEILLTSELRNLNYKARKLPPLALHCGITDIMPFEKLNGWTVEVTNYFIGIIGNQEKHQKVSMQVFHETKEIPKKYDVDLFIVGESNSISCKETLLALQFCKNWDSEPNLAQNNSSILQEREFARDVNVEIVISNIESPDLFHVQKKCNILAINKLVNDMKAHYESHQSYECAVYVTELSKIIACKLNDNWYRGLIVEKIIEEQDSPSDEKVVLDVVTSVRVYFIDFGFKSIVPVHDIYKLHPKFYQQSAQALKVELFGIEPVSNGKWPNNIKEILTEILATGDFFINVQDILNEIHRAILYKRNHTDEVVINKLLVEKGLALSKSPKIQSMHHKKIKVFPPRKNLGRNNKNGPIKYKKSKRVELTRSERDSQSLSSTVEESDSELLEQEEIETEECRRKYNRVVIPYVEDPHHIYVTSYNGQKHVQRLNYKIQQSYNLDTLETQEPEWKVLDKCIAYSDERLSFGRAKILQLSVEAAKIFFIDFGLKQEIPISHLRTLKPELAEDNVGVLACSLSGIQNPDPDSNKWPEYVTTRVQEIIENNGFLYISKSDAPVQDGVLPIHLWVKVVKVAGPFSPSITTWTCVNKILVNEGLAISDGSEFNGESFTSSYTVDTLRDEDIPTLPKVVSNVDDDFIRNDEEDDDDIIVPTLVHSAKVDDWLPPPPLQRLKVTIKPTYVDFNCHIYFIDPDRIAECEQIQKSLTAHYDNSPLNNSDMFWSENQACIVKYYLDEKWYRGKIQKIGDDGKYDVFFVDYGNFEDYDVNALRKEVCFVDVPTFAQKCSFYNLEPVERGTDTFWSTKVLDELHTNLVDKYLEVELSPPLTPNGPYLIQSLVDLECGEDMIQHFVQNDILKYSTIEDNMADLPQGSALHSVPSIISENNTESDETSLNTILPGIQDSVIRDIPLDVNDEESDSEYEHEHLKDLSWFALSEIQHLCENAMTIRYPTLDIPETINVVKVNVMTIQSVRPTVSLICNIIEPFNLEIKKVLEKYQELKDTLQNQANEQPLLQIPRRRMKCIAFYQDNEDLPDGVWERSEILSVNGKNKTVSVYLIDTGFRKNNVSFDYIRALKPEWVDVPLQGIICTLDGIQASPSQDDKCIIEELGNLLENSSVQDYFIKIKNRSVNGNLTVDLYEDPETTVLACDSLIDSGTFVHP